MYAVTMRQHFNRLNVESRNVEKNNVGCNQLQMYFYSISNTLTLALTLAHSLAPRESLPLAPSLSDEPEARETKRTGGGGGSGGGGGGGGGPRPPPPAPHELGRT